MSDTPTTRKRGRPATGKARTAAQRMADSRLRALEALAASTEPDLSGVSTTGLFEALRVAYRQGNPWDMAAVTAELFERTNARASHPVAVSFRGIEASNSATVAKTQPTEAPAISATVTESQADPSPDNSATVAVNPTTAAPDKTATVAKKREPYPPEIKRQAAEMFDSGKTKDDTLAWIESAIGRPFDRRNFARLIKQGRKLLPS